MDDFPVIDILDNDLGDVPLDFPKVTHSKGYTDFVNCFTVYAEWNYPVAQGYKGPKNYYYDKETRKKIHL